MKISPSVLVACAALLVSVVLVCICFRYSGGERGLVLDRWTGRVFQGYPD